MNRLTNRSTSPFVSLMTTQLVGTSPWLRQRLVTDMMSPPILITLPQKIPVENSCQRPANHGSRQKNMIVSCDVARLVGCIQKSSGSGTRHDCRPIIGCCVDINLKSASNTPWHNRRCLSTYHTTHPVRHPASAHQQLQIADILSRQLEHWKK